MKSLIILCAAVAVCSAGFIPPAPDRNITSLGGDGRYIWVPHGDDDFMLIDTEEPVSEEELRASERAGNNNQYWLFTRNNRNTHQRLHHNNINSVRNSHYNRNNPLLVVVHGYNGKGSSGMNQLITRNYLDSVNGNVIVVDWQAAGVYNVVARRVVSVGRYLGNFLVWLIGNAGGNWNNVHLVGFSLGAHVVGNAGRTAGRRPVRITGLDPAGPTWGGNRDALNRNDGVYVESIHTDGGLYGIFDPISDADFYPNGGRHRQPNCSSHSCSHSRAHYLFASSIRNNRFRGQRCANLQQMRDDRCSGNVLLMGNTNLSKRGSGLFRLETTGTSPFI